MSNRKHLTRMTPKMDMPRAGFPWKRAGLLVMAITVLAGISWSVRFYHAYAMPNVSVAGASVGLKTRAEVAQAVAVQADEMQLVFEAGNSRVSPKLEDAGVAIDQVATVNAVFAARRIDDMPGGLAVWQTVNVPLVVSVDEQKLEAYIDAAFPDSYEAPQQPGLTYNPSVNQFDSVPGKNGTGFDIADIARLVNANAAQPGRITVSATNDPIPPGIPDAAVAYVQDEANRRLLLRLNFLYQNKLIYFPEPSEMAEWFLFTPSRDGTKLVATYDENRMALFLRGRVTASLNSFFGPDVSESAGVKEPLQLTGTDALVGDMVVALRTLQPLEKEVEAAAISAGSEEKMTL